jgi:hypothetical protein
MAHQHGGDAVVADASPGAANMPTVPPTDDSGPLSTKTDAQVHNWIRQHEVRKSTSSQLYCGPRPLRCQSVAA